MLSAASRLIRSSGASFLSSPNHFTNAVRGRKNWLRPYLKDLYKRREAAGPEPERPRSAWINWNYDAEIYSFGKRLGEEFKSETLRKAFTMRSYIDQEQVKRSELGMETELKIEDNQQLVQSGDRFLRDHITQYIRHCWPLLPSDGIRSVIEYLLTEERLSHVATHIGCKDLILTQEFPSHNETISTVMKAVVGALLHDQGKTRAGRFVEDLILTELVGKHVLDFWTISNPMGRLTQELSDRKMSLPEPRLISVSGKNTILAVYTVGIYSDKRQIGIGHGETASIAEQSAATDALLSLLNLSESRPALPFYKTSSASSSAQAQLSS